MKTILFLLAAMTLPLAAQSVTITPPTAIPAAAALGSSDGFVVLQGADLYLASDAQMLAFTQNGTVLTTGTYTNPAWLAGLAWSKVSSTPTTISGYGITDAVTLTGMQTLTNKSIAAGQITGLGSLALVTPAGTPSSTTFLQYNGTTYSWATVTPYSLPAASVGTIGGVAPDGTTILVDGSGNISVGTVPYSHISGTPTYAAVATSGLFSALLSIPTTISGYGITDGVTLTGAQTLTNKSIAASEINSGTLTVSQGGTGVSTTTAYAPVVGGTTGTGALQSASTGMSNAGYVFTSNGSSAAPSFQAPSIAWTVVSANTTLTAGENAWIDAAYGSLTVTLPSSPPNGTTIMVADFFGGWSAHPQTVSGPGGLINTPSGAVSSIVFNHNYTIATFTYTTTAFGSAFWVETDSASQAAQLLAVQTGTLSSGTATETVPSGCHPWVTDTSSTPHAISVTVSGSTATIEGTGTDTFSLFNFGSD